MAWRIDEFVLRGEIDNRIRGQVTGYIWLLGMSEPMTLHLQGDAWPDLAGCRLVWKNPNALPFPDKHPSTRQMGQVGTITASRKVRVFDIPMEEAYLMLKAGGSPPEHMANCLYLEWFGEINGRIVIESVDYFLEISEPAWRFTAAEIADREARISECDNPFITWINPDEDSTQDEDFDA